MYFCVVFSWVRLLCLQELGIIVCHTVNCMPIGLVWPKKPNQSHGVVAPAATNYLWVVWDIAGAVKATICYVISIILYN